jgi:hypothetical protein
MHSFDEGSTMKITVRNDKPAATYQPA